MSVLFQAPVSVVVTIDNKKFPTSSTFAVGHATKVLTPTGVQEVWTNADVTKNVALNSNFLSGEVELRFHQLARYASPSDQEEIQKLAVPHLSQALEIGSALIREGKVVAKQDGMPPKVYVMYAKDSSLMFYHGMSGWEVYWQPAKKRLGSLYDFEISMYDIGKQCTVISVAK